MFRKKQRLLLSDDMRDALDGLRADLGTLAELVQGVLDSSQHLEESLEMIANGHDDMPGAGIQVVEEEPKEEPKPVLPRGRRTVTPNPPLDGPPKDKTPPPVGAVINPGAMTEDRRRESPFTRAPRSKQAEWLRKEVLSDGQWHDPYDVAMEYANDERHLRYLKHAMAGRLREMYEDRQVERRKSNGRSLFEYRLRTKS